MKEAWDIAGYRAMPTKYINTKARHHARSPCDCASATTWRPQAGCANRSEISCPGLPVAKMAGTDTRAAPSSPRAVLLESSPPERAPDVGAGPRWHHAPTSAAGRGDCTKWHE